MRRSGDGKTGARLKPVDGILGISFDKLVQRDQPRGYRRIALVAVAAVLALVVLSTFTVVTITSRRDAEAQRSHAEGLVEFMLGDLRTRLAPEGRLATLDAARNALERTADRFEQREFLRALGEAALAEHAEWTLMHRERPLERARM